MEILEKQWEILVMNPPEDVTERTSEHQITGGNDTSARGVLRNKDRSSTRRPRVNIHRNAHRQANGQANGVVSCCATQCCLASC